MIATYNGKKKLVRLLLENEADISLKDRFGKTALERAKNPQMAQILQDYRKARQGFKNVGRGLGGPKPSRIFQSGFMETFSPSPVRKVPNPTKAKSR